jgi:hypothetical protein
MANLAIWLIVAIQDKKTMGYRIQQLANRWLRLASLWEVHLPLMEDVEEDRTPG